MTNAFSFAGLEDDDEVRAAIRSLALHAIDEARELLDNSAPMVKMQMIRQLIPPLAKSLASGKGEDDAMQEIRTALEGLYADARQEWGDDE